MKPNPLTRAEQSVSCGNLRVTVLTSRLLRIEYAANAAFEDRATLDISNREFPPCAFTSDVTSSTLSVDTGAVHLFCSDTTSPPTAESLRLTDNSTSAGTTSVDLPLWHFGMDGSGNLGGTVRTLDMWKGDSLQRVTGFDADTGFIREWDPQPLGDGVLSTQGWALIDDSGTVVLDQLPDSPVAKAWPTPREQGHICDIYLFCYGTDHRQALAAANALIGPQVLPPRYAFGYWYSRYYPYTDGELIELIDSLDRFGIPVDVLVIDMDWHRVGWTGYSWDRDLFPDPTATLARIHAHGLRVTLNLHPADGVGSHEDHFDEFCEAMRLDTSSHSLASHDGSTGARSGAGSDSAQQGVGDEQPLAGVPFDPTNPRFVDAYFRILHHPEEERGVDFWWLDWQQGTESQMDGLDPLSWLNQLHWDDQVETHAGRRPLNFSRWDGPGAAHRPIGFSGDTFACWESLAFQPKFTATAANILFGYWSHDIGGHFGGSADAELYLRWIQLGAHSPILRTHGSVDTIEERRIWEYPNPYRDLMIAALRRRYELIPYIYGECRRGVVDGLSLVRPMYHDYPHADAAYSVDSQYMFGSQMIVAPIVEASDNADLARAAVWLPHGRWFDTVRGHVIEVSDNDGALQHGSYLLDEIPIFVKAGAIVPTQLGVSRLGKHCYPNLAFELYPHAASNRVSTSSTDGDPNPGEYALYEDDGLSTGYLQGEAVITHLAQSESPHSRCFVMRPASGDYQGWDQHRQVEVLFIGEPPPSDVTITDFAGEKAVLPSECSWHYDLSRAAVVVTIPNVDLRVGLRVEITRPADAYPASARASSGIPGLLRRLSRIDQDIRVLLNDDSRLLARLARTADRVRNSPASFSDELDQAFLDIEALRGVLESAKGYWAQGEALNPTEPPRASRALTRAQNQLAVALAEYHSLL